MSRDDVIDYMVMEAVATKVAEEDKQAAKERQRREWKKDTKELDQYR